MYLRYNSIHLDTNGFPISPTLRLQNLSGKTHGILNNAKDLRIDVNFAELSEISFSIPRIVDGEVHPLYEQLAGYKVVHTDKYGVYLLTTPETIGSGMEETKNIKGYSIEKTFERKKLFIPEGTYALYSSKDDTNTIVSFIKDLDPTWEIRHVDDALKCRYRTFDKYDGDALSFMYGVMMEKYRCLVVFDPYKSSTGKRGIYLYDADAEATMSRIYLSYENLLKETNVTELSDELVTKLNVYGADNLSIRDVNPTGQDYIVNLDHFIDIGDIDEELGRKVTAWQNKIAESRSEYTTLAALKASASAKKFSLEAQKVELEGELNKLILEQSAIFQKIALDKTNDANGSLATELSEKNSEISAKEAEIEKLGKQISSAQTSVDNYTTKISNIAKSLRFSDYEDFTAEDRHILDQYMIEDTVTEETFVATSYETSAQSCFSNHGSTTLTIQNTETNETIALEDTSKTLFRAKGGRLTLSDTMHESDISAEVVDLVIERTRTGTSVYKTEILLSARVNNVAIGDKTFESGNLTIILPEISTSTLPVFSDGNFTARNSSATSYFTADVTEFEKYSVQNELYDHGLTILSEQAFPFYEFTIESGNFIFAQEFEKFKDELELGKGVYLMLGSHGRITAPLIGVGLDFSDIASLELTFSNKFQKSDGKARLKELLEKSYSSSRNFDASQYAYKETAKQMGFVSEYLSSSLDAAKNNILAAADQSVKINGAGITLTSSDPAYAPYQMRLINNMLAITNDNWQTASLAIGLMPLPSHDNENLMGMVVNADVIAGKLLIGENLVIESQAADGETVHFRFDEDGAYLRNATLLSETANKSSQILIDPNLGIAMGKAGVVKEGEDGSLSIDSSKASFYFDPSGNLKISGNITMSGNITWDATSNPTKVLYARTKLSKPTLSYDSYTSTTGWHPGLTASDKYASYSYSGGAAGSWSEVVQIVGTTPIKGTDYFDGKSAYEIAVENGFKGTEEEWLASLGLELTDDALFNLLTNNSNNVGIFSYEGTTSKKLFINATYVHGGTLSGCSININDNFLVDDSGNVTLNGNITWGASNSPVKVLYAESQLTTPTNKYSNYGSNHNSTSWHTTLHENDYYASYSYSGGVAGSWTAPIRIRGKDGDSVNIDEEAIFNMLTTGETMKGLFYSDDNKLYVNADYIKSGTFRVGYVDTTKARQEMLIGNTHIEFYRNNSLKGFIRCDYENSRSYELEIHNDDNISIYSRKQTYIEAGEELSINCNYAGGIEMYDEDKIIHLYGGHDFKGHILFDGGLVLNNKSGVQYGRLSDRPLSSNAKRGQIFFVYE